MFGLIGKKIINISDEQKTDGDGMPYRATKWNYQGKSIEVNIDRYGYHARADGQHVKVNMDEGGLIGWLLSWFGE